MCYASRSINEQLELLRNKKEELINEATTYDRLVSKLYHELEGLELTETAGFSMAKRMQVTLRERRKIKYDLMQIKTLMNQLEVALRMLVANEKDYFKENKNYKTYIY